MHFKVETILDWYRSKQSLENSALPTILTWICVLSCCQQKYAIVEGGKLLCWYLEPVPWVMQVGTGPGHPLLPSLLEGVTTLATEGLLVCLFTM